jgi:hypothetical protein
VKIPSEITSPLCPPDPTATSDTMNSEFLQTSRPITCAELIMKIQIQNISKLSPKPAQN